MASELDKLQKVGIGTATTLSAPGKAAAATSITVGSTANFPTTTGITFAIRVVDGNGELVAGTYTEWVGTVTSGTTLAMNAVPVYGSDQVYTAGSTTQVYMPLSSYSYNKMIDGLLEEHEQLDGTHKATLITSRTEDTSPDPDADFLLTYDTSATALKKVKPSSLGIGDSWARNSLPAVSSVTENGNRSADITFASTVASILTPGMRLRTTRTVTAPTQCADLESSSSQYFNKTSPNGMTFTDDFVVSAWVKLESYANFTTIASRYNGTSGWEFKIGALGAADGRIQLTAFNAGAANFSYVVSYQSIPLGKWVHVTAQLDMSAFTATSTTSYIMIDGVDVPATVGRGGTNPTALVQAGNLEIGSENGGSQYFDGKIAQVAIYSAKVTQATIRASKNQTLSGSETSLVSAYSFNNSINDLNANANNLTAQGSALATNADSPFTLDANGVAAGTYDWAIVTKVNAAVATVQYPEGCAIPTSGGISTVDYSTTNAFGFPPKDRFSLVYVYKSDFTQTSPVSGTWYNLTTTSGTTGGMKINLPVARWKRGYDLAAICTNGTNQPNVFATMSTGAATESDSIMTSALQVGTQIANMYIQGKLSREDRTPVDVTTATDYYVNAKTGTASAGTLAFRCSTDFPGTIYADLAYL